MALFKQFLRAKECCTRAKVLKAAALAFDKIESKRRFIEHGRARRLRMSRLRKGEILDLAIPYVVKVPCQGSSVGVYIVKEAAEECNGFGKSICASRYDIG